MFDLNTAISFTRFACIILKSVSLVTISLFQCVRAFCLLFSVELSTIKV